MMNWLTQAMAWDLQAENRKDINNIACKTMKHLISKSDQKTTGWMQAYDRWNHRMMWRGSDATSREKNIFGGSMNEWYVSEDPVKT